MILRGSPPRWAKRRSPRRHPIWRRESGNASKRGPPYARVRAPFLSGAPPFPWRPLQRLSWSPSSGWAGVASLPRHLTLLMRCKTPSCPLPRRWLHLLPRRPSLKSLLAPHPGKPRAWRITRSVWREPLLLPPFPVTPRHRRHPPLPRRRRKMRRLLAHEEPAANCSTKCCLPA